MGLFVTLADNEYLQMSKKVELRVTVKQYLAHISRTVPEFKDNLPGKTLSNHFLSRHKKLCMRLSKSIWHYSAGISADVEIYFLII